MRTDALGTASRSRPSGVTATPKPDAATAPPLHEAPSAPHDEPSHDAPTPSSTQPAAAAAPIPAGALAPGSDVRVDTWLWATRQVKSRSQATAAARAGHVKVNGDTAKAAQKVRVGDEVRLRVEGFDRILEVTQLLVKRVGAPQARLCYVDHSPERPRIVGVVPVRDRGAGRPSKKERRELDRLRGRDSHERA